MNSDNVKQDHAIVLPITNQDMIKRVFEQYMRVNHPSSEKENTPCEDDMETERIKLEDMV